MARARAGAVAEAAGPVRVRGWQGGGGGECGLFEEIAAVNGLFIRTSVRLHAWCAADNVALNVRGISLDLSAYRKPDDQSWLSMVSRPREETETGTDEPSAPAAAGESAAAEFPVPAEADGMVPDAGADTAVARGDRSVPHLGFGDHAAADAGGRGD